MSRNGPSPSVLATASRMRSEGSTWPDISKALSVGESTLRRWDAEGLLEEIDVSGETGIDILRAVALKAAGVSDATRVSAASALARAEALDRDLGEQVGGQVVSFSPFPPGMTEEQARAKVAAVSCGCQHCKETLETLRPPKVPTSCRQAGAHHVINARLDPNRPGQVIRKRACGCL